MAKENIIREIEIPQDLLGSFNQIVQMEKDIYDKQREFEILSRQTWAEVEMRYDLRGKLLKYNREKQQIHVMSDMEDEDREMLKRVREGKASPLNPLGAPLPKPEAKPWWKVW